MTTDDREQAALAWLYSFADWERGVGWNPNAAPAEQWKLGRTRALLDLAGAPDRDIRIVHIAGTKGKGSTGAYVESIARAAGLRTGWYSQPHLHTYRERIKRDGRLISIEAFARQVERLKSLVMQLAAAYPDAGDPTTFELTTVLAVLAFAEAGVEVAIVEVGLGGRLDATNALHTDLSVITTIGMDHQQILGRSLAKIASEKAGIIRPGQTVIAATQRPPARRVIEDRCRELGAPLQVAKPLSYRPATGRVHAWLRDPVLHQDSAWTAETLGIGPSRGRPSRAQRQNAALATAVASWLNGKGLPVTVVAVVRGLTTAWLPARQEIVSTSPLLVVDAAHNVDSARALADALRRLEPAGQRFWLVLGMLRDKDARAVLRPLLKLARGVVVSTPSSPRALPSDHLAAACRALSDVRVDVAPSVADALRRARSLAAHDTGIVVAGSFVTAAEARTALGLADVLTPEDHAAWLARGAPLAL